MTCPPPELYVADDWILWKDLDPTAIPAHLSAAKAQGVWHDVVPGLDSLALAFDPLEMDADTAKNHVMDLAKTVPDAIPSSLSPVALSVCYDAAFGPDQTLVAEHLGIAVADLPSWHMAQDYSVAMIGFLPGFAYLRARADIPAIPRLATPRAQVAAGSVGLLGPQCGLYPAAGPGGWPLIGRVAARLFDSHRIPPALLQPGQKVAFRAISRDEYETSER